jgi:hypothetical protein
VYFVLLMLMMIFVKARGHLQERAAKEVSEGPFVYFIALMLMMIFVKASEHLQERAARS